MLSELFEAVIQHSGIGEYLGAMGQGCETVKAQGLRAGVQCTEVIFQRACLVRREKSIDNKGLR